jgi:hypothetical protein
MRARLSCISRKPDNNPFDSQETLLVAVRLDPQRGWPPALPTASSDAGGIDSREQQPAARPARRFPSGAIALQCLRPTPFTGPRRPGCSANWPQPPARLVAAAPPDEPLNSERFVDWHRALEQLQLQHSDDLPLSWLNMC